MRFSAHIPYPYCISRGLGAQLRLLQVWSRVDDTASRQSRRNRDGGGDGRRIRRPIFLHQQDVPHGDRLYCEAHIRRARSGSGATFSNLCHHDGRGLAEATRRYQSSSISSGPIEPSDSQWLVGAQIAQGQTRHRPRNLPLGRRLALVPTCSPLCRGKQPLPDRQDQLFLLAARSLRLLQLSRTSRCAT